jgi:spermidine synthase
MGFTLTAALRRVGEQSRVLVAELVPQVVLWNRGEAGKYSGHPLQDKRVTVKETDVAAILRDTRQTFDAILLDVDNGPEGLTRPENDWLYSLKGLTAAAASLRDDGVLAIWSSSPDSAFLQRLYKAGFKVEEVQVRSHGKKGTRHIIWFATL